MKKALMRGLTLTMAIFLAGCGGFSSQCERGEVVIGGQTVIPKKTCVLYGAREISTGVSRDDCFNHSTSQVEESQAVRDAGLTAVIGATVKAVGVGTAGYFVGQGLKGSGTEIENAGGTAHGGAGGTGQGGAGGAGGLGGSTGAITNTNSPQTCSGDNC